MEYSDGYETIKQRLIIAGIKEIENHGIADCSLRRVASMCNVSCAAPYKHFKDKDEFIAEIISYIHNQWNMFAEHVASVFEGNLRKQLTETCIAYIKFWIANPNFRIILTMKSDNSDETKKNPVAQMSEGINELIGKCCTQCGYDEEKTKVTTYKIRSLLYGATIMTDSGELDNTAATADMIRKCIEEEFM